MARINCFDKFKDGFPEVHEYLKNKSKVDFNGQKEGKEAYIKAIKELQENSLNTINDVYASIGIEGYSKKEAVAPAQSPKAKVASAVIEINGKTYEGNNHAEAILKAKADGQDISQVNRKAQGKFKLSDGTIIDRAEAKERFGQDRSELLIKQDAAADQANKDYAKITSPKDTTQEVEGVEAKKPAAGEGVVPSGLKEGLGHKKNIQNKFRKEFEGKGVPKEQVDGAIALMEARAKSWASEEKGRTSEQWYDKIADVKSGEFETGDVQFQGGKLKAAFIGAMTVLQPMKINDAKVEVRTEQTSKTQSKDEKAVIDILNNYYKENDEKPPQEVIDRALYLWNKFGRPEILPDSTSKDERAFATYDGGKSKMGNITNFDDFVAELSHSAQYVSGKKMDNREYATQSERDKVEYEREGSMEYKAHKEVEPILAKYIFTGDSTELNKIQYQESGGVKHGAVETLADGRKVIHALDAPDFSTMVHEIAHVFEGDLTDAESKLVKDFGGSESFARGFERYLRNGIAPSKEMIPLFQKFRNWLIDIYKSFVGTPIEKRVSPDIKKIFDRLLTEQTTPTKGEGRVKELETQRDVEIKKAMKPTVDLDTDSVNDDIILTHPDRIKLKNEKKRIGKERDKLKELIDCIYA